MRKVALITVVLLVFLALALTACGDNQEAQKAQSDPAIEGLALFQSVGCAGCHGQDGEGGTGPALAGHTVDQVQRQVRTPTGDIMPAFSQEQLSDDQLALVVAWVESLGPVTGDHAHGHEEPAGETHNAEEAGGDHDDDETASETDAEEEAASDHGHDETAGETHNAEEAGGDHDDDETASETDAEEETDGDHGHDETAGDAHSSEEADSDHGHDDTVGDEQQAGEDASGVFCHTGR